MIRIAIVLAALAVMAVVGAAFRPRPRAQEALRESNVTTHHQPHTGPSCAPPGRTAAPAASREVAREMARRIARGGSPTELKACYDAIRHERAAAIPALTALLDGSEGPAVAVAALNALGGLRRMLADAWPADATLAMLEAATRLLRESPDVRFDAIGTLHDLADVSDDAQERLVAAAASETDPSLRDRALKLAGDRLRGRSLQVLAALALDPSRDADFRMKAAAACVRAAPETRPSFADVCARSAELCRDESESIGRRALALETYGRLGGAEARPALLAALSSGTEDALRCAAIVALVDTVGPRPVFAELSSVASESRPSRASTMVKRILGRSR
jgi:hypothetical protein